MTSLWKITLMPKKMVSMSRLFSLGEFGILHSNIHVWLVLSTLHAD
jgi:hypothetical protein